MNFTIQENDSTGNKPVTHGDGSTEVNNMTNGVSTKEISPVINESVDVVAAAAAPKKDVVEDLYSDMIASFEAYTMKQYDTNNKTPEPQTPEPQTPEPQTPDPDFRKKMLKQWKEEFLRQPGGSMYSKSNLRWYGCGHVPFETWFKRKVADQPMYSKKEMEKVIKDMKG